MAGPALIHPSNSFGMDGYLAMLIGQNVLHSKPWNAPESGEAGANDAANWPRMRSRA